MTVLTVLIAAPTVPKSVEDNRIYIYVFLALAVATLLVAWLTKNVPAVRKVWDSWTSARRRATKAARTAQIDDLETTVKHSTRRIAQLETELQEIRDTLTRHREWDWQAVDAILAYRTGQTPTQEVTMPPPPLFPPPKPSSS